MLLCWPTVCPTPESSPDAAFSCRLLRRPNRRRRQLSTLPARPFPSPPRRQPGCLRLTHRLQQAERPFQPPQEQSPPAQSFQPLPRSLPAPRQAAPHRLPAPHCPRYQAHRRPAQRPVLHQQPAPALRPFQPSLQPRRQPIPLCQLNRPPTLRRHPHSRQPTPLNHRIHRFLNHQTHPVERSRPDSQMGSNRPWLPQAGKMPTFKAFDRERLDPYTHA